MIGRERESGTRESGLGRWMVEAGAHGTGVACWRSASGRGVVLWQSGGGGGNTGGGGGGGWRRVGGGQNTPHQDPTASHISTSMSSGFLRYDSKRFENRTIVAPSTTRWSADHPKCITCLGTTFPLSSNATIFSILPMAPMATCGAKTTGMAQVAPMVPMLDSVKVVFWKCSGNNLLVDASSCHVQERQWRAAAAGQKSCNSGKGGPSSWGNLSKTRGGGGGGGGLEIREDVLRSR